MRGRNSEPLQSGRNRRSNSFGFNRTHSAATARFAETLRYGRRRAASGAARRVGRPTTMPLHAGDMLVVEGTPEALKTLADRTVFWSSAMCKRPERKGFGKNSDYFADAFRRHRVWSFARLGADCDGGGRRLRGSGFDEMPASARALRRD